MLIFVFYLSKIIVVLALVFVSTIFLIGALKIFRSEQSGRSSLGLINTLKGIKRRQDGTVIGIAYDLSVNQVIPLCVQAELHQN